MRRIHRVLSAVLFLLSLYGSTLRLEGAPHGPDGGGEAARYSGIEDLRGYADLAVHGVVRSVTPLLLHESPFQEVLVDVRRVLLPAGTDVGSVRVLVLGGEAEGHETAIPGAPDFEAGQEVVLFLKAWEGAYLIVGIQQGLFRVVEVEGRRLAVRDFTWASLVDPPGGLVDGAERLPLDVVLGEGGTESPMEVPARTPNMPPALLLSARESVVPDLPARAPRTARSGRDGSNATGWGVALLVAGLLALLRSTGVLGRLIGRRPTSSACGLLAAGMATALALAVPARSEAYGSRFTDSTGAIASRWVFDDGSPEPSVIASSRSVQYAIQVGGTSDVPGDQEKDTIASIATSWSTTGMASFHWVRIADDTRPLSEMRSGDKKNVIYWLTGTSVDPHGLDLHYIPSLTFLRTSIAGEISDADICLNGRDFTWGITGNLNDWSRPDVGSTVAHELGHAAGLDHSAMLSATMAARRPMQDPTSARSLTLDDQIGLAVKYPSAAFGTRTGSIYGTIRTTTGRRLHRAIISVHRLISGEVVAAVLSRNGSFNVRGLDPGSYVLQTQALGRTSADSLRFFQTVDSLSASTDFHSIASEDLTATVQAGRWTGVTLVVEEGATTMSASLLCLRSADSEHEFGFSPPIMAHRSDSGRRIGLVGGNLPMTQGEVSSVRSSGVIEMGFTGQAQFDAPLANIEWTLFVSASARLGPRTLELTRTDGSRLLVIGGIEVVP